MIRKAFGNALRHLRKRRGFSQEDLAAKGKMNRAQISRMENGFDNPRLNMLHRLSRLLNIPFRTFTSEIARQMEELGIESGGGIELETEMLPGGILYIARTGRLDLLTAGPFVEELFTLAKTRDALKILIDLSAAECVFTDTEEYRSAMDSLDWMTRNSFWPIVAVIGNSTLKGFGADVAKEHGHKVDLFSSKPQALKWLEGQNANAKEARNVP